MEGLCRYVTKLGFFAIYRHCEILSNKLLNKSKNGYPNFHPFLNIEAYSVEANSTRVAQEGITFIPMKTLRSHTTILFADLASSTQLGESMDPEHFASLLKQMRDMAETVISKHGGIINQLYGDGLMAAFGFMTPREDDALRAISAALELNELIATLPPFHDKYSHQHKLQLHTGVHTDLVFVQEGDNVIGRYKLTGDALVIATKLSDAAAPGEVIASAPTICNLLPYFQTQHLPKLPVKGRQTSLEAYKVFRPTGVRNRFEASKNRGLTPLIGRQEQLAQITTYYRQSQMQGCHYIQLCGSSGLGKTRLAEEFLRQVPKQTKILKVYCKPDYASERVQPFVQLLNLLFGLNSSFPKSYSRQRFMRVLQQNYPSLVCFEKEYLSLLGLNESCHPTSENNNAVSALTALIQHLIKTRSLIIYLDDWHLVDNSSSDNLISIMQALRDDPVLILTTSVTQWQGFNDEAGETLQLKPLSHQYCSKLASKIFAPFQLKHYADMLFAQSGGNPLYIEELCHSILASTCPRLYEGQLDYVPVTLAGLVGEQLSHLPKDIFELVKIGAVLGRSFHGKLFETIVGAPLHEDQITALARLNLIESDVNKHTYYFCNGLTRSVAYEKIGYFDKRELHIRIAKVLDQNPELGDGATLFEQLAYHHQGAKNWPEAGRFSELAGDQAHQRMALDEAGSHYKRALHALDPATCPDGDYETWKQVLNKFGWISVFDPLKEYSYPLQRAATITEREQDYPMLAKTQYWLAYLDYAMGNTLEAAEYGKSALRMARHLNMSSLKVETTALLGQIHGASGNYQTALTLLDEAIEAKQSYRCNKDLRTGSSYALACKAAILGDQGNFSAAQNCFSNALAILDGTGHFHLEGSVLGLKAVVHLWQGKWHSAKQLAQKAYEKASQVSRPYMSGLYLSIAAYAEWKINGSEMAIKTVLFQTRNLEKYHRRLYLSLNYGCLAEMYANTDNWGQTRNFAARAIRRARKNDRLGEVMAYRALAIVSERHKPGSGQPYLERAQTAARKRKSHHEIARNHLLQASILQQNQNFTGALHYLNNAATEFRALGMEHEEQQALDLIYMNSESA